MGRGRGEGVKTCCSVLQPRAKRRDVMLSLSFVTVTHPPPAASGAHAERNRRLCLPRHRAASLVSLELGSADYGVLYKTAQFGSQFIYDCHRARARGKFQCNKSGPTQVNAP